MVRGESSRNLVFLLPVRRRWRAGRGHGPDRFFFSPSVFVGFSRHPQKLGTRGPVPPCPAWRKGIFAPVGFFFCVEDEDEIDPLFLTGDTHLLFVFSFVFFVWGVGGFLAGTG